MTGRDKLIWLGGGLALCTFAVRRSAASASRVESSIVKDVLDRPPATGGGVSRKYDDLFARYGRGLPVAYLRSLGKRESNLNPLDQKGPAWGLLQVIEVVRRDFNDRNGTSHSRRDLLSPRINVTIAADLLTRIIASYRRNHSGTRNLQADWRNPRFVELLTFGWNAGYSERGGVGRVARYLESRGLADTITIDTIHQSARSAGASPAPLKRAQGRVVQGRRAALRA